MRWVALFLLVGCAPVTVQRWGYNEVPAYTVAASQVSPSGIRFDDSGQHISGPLLDRLTSEVEKCTGHIDRSSFMVKIPKDWALSCDGSQQVLSSPAPESGCRTKGLDPTKECPCRWRALIQWPNVIVATPSLYLYKDALSRFVSGSRDPWGDPKLVACVQPTTGPLSTGNSP